MRMAGDGNTYTDAMDRSRAGVEAPEAPSTTKEIPAAERVPEQDDEQTNAEAFEEEEAGIAAKE
jgi:hypothetical protein